MPCTPIKLSDGTTAIVCTRGWAICRRGGAVAVTIDHPIPGFRGFRHRWWQRENELPFPNWKTDGIPESMRRCLEGRMRA